MTTFDERERALENRFAHDADLRFRALARRNFKLGMWAAARLGLTGSDAEEHARQVVDFAVARQGDAAVVDHLLKAFEQRGLQMAREEIIHTMAALMTEAEQDARGA